jgi:hypothetical protein
MKVQPYISTAAKLVRARAHQIGREAGMDVS